MTCIRVGRIVARTAAVIAGAVLLLGGCGGSDPAPRPARPGASVAFPGVRSHESIVGLFEGLAAGASPDRLRARAARFRFEPEDPATQQHAAALRSLQAIARQLDSPRAAGASVDRLGRQLGVARSKLTDASLDNRQRYPDTYTQLEKASSRFLRARKRLQRRVAR